MATIDTIGPVGCDYTTPHAWWAARGGDIRSDANAPYIGEIVAGQYSQFEMASDGSTWTDADHYFELRAAADDRFRGDFDGSYPKIAGIKCSVPYTRFKYIVSNGISADAFTAFSLDAVRVSAHGCGAYDITQNGYLGAYFAGIYASSAGTTVTACAVASITLTNSVVLAGALV
jgi:hypothetical protein